MKKLIQKITAILLIGLLIFITYQIIIKINHKLDIRKNIQTIPAFRLISTNNSIFTQDSLAYGKPTIFLYFNTECDFCQHEIKSIKKQMNEFKNISLIFISSEPLNDILNFANSNKLSMEDNIIFLQDSVLDFACKFDTNIIPYTLIYNKDRELIKRIKGQMQVETILNILNNEK